MQHSPLKDKDIGVIIDYETKFADVRQKAKEEYIRRKAKRKRDKTTPVPETSPGKQVVVTETGYRANTQYYLFEVVDFNLSYGETFKYVGILLKTTDKTRLDRIGRLGTFSGGECNWSLRMKLTKLAESEIKWLDNDGNVT